MRWHGDGSVGNLYRRRSGVQDNVETAENGLTEAVNHPKATITNTLIRRSCSIVSSGIGDRPPFDPTFGNAA